LNQKGFINPGNRAEEKDSNTSADSLGEDGDEVLDEQFMVIFFLL